MDNSFPGGELMPDASIEPALAAQDRGGVVTARGTNDGLVIRLDGRVELESLRSALTDFLDSRRGFLAGNPVSLEWVGIKPADILVNEISDLLCKDYGINVRSSRLREPLPTNMQPTSNENELSNVRDIGIARQAKDGEASLGLFGGVEAIAVTNEITAPAFDSRADSSMGDALLWDDPDARIIYATLRSGQKIETEHSLVVFGDINSGAEIVAGGDIVVLGTLRGVAHAGAYDETGGGRFIFALNLAPTQLRIGSIISRGSSEGQKGAEIARVEANMIIVEGYQSRNFVTKRRG